MATSTEEKAETNHASFDNSEERANSTDPKSKDGEIAAPAVYIPENDEEYVVTL